MFYNMLINNNNNNNNNNIVPFQAVKDSLFDISFESYVRNSIENALIIGENEVFIKPNKLKLNISNDEINDVVNKLKKYNYNVSYEDDLLIIFF